MKAAFKVCLLFVLLALVGPGNALALTSQQAVEKIRAAFDEKTIRQGLDEVRYFKKAGFIYQPALSVPRSGTCPIEEIWDQKAVMSTCPMRLASMARPFSVSISFCSVFCSSGVTPKGATWGMSFLRISVSCLKSLYVP